MKRKVTRRAFLHKGYSQARTHQIAQLDRCTPLIVPSNAIMRGNTSCSARCRSSGKSISVHGKSSTRSKPTKRWERKMGYASSCSMVSRPLATRSSRIDRKSKASLRETFRKPTEQRRNLPIRHGRYLPRDRRASAASVLRRCFQRCHQVGNNSRVASESTGQSWQPERAHQHP